MADVLQPALVSLRTFGEEGPAALDPGLLIDVGDVDTPMKSMKNFN